MGFKKTKFTNPFPQIRQRAKPVAGEISGETAVEVLDLAKQFVPVDSGELRDSGMVEQTGSTSHVVKFTAPHARHVHFGTVFQAANPFFFTAIELTRREFKRAQRSFFQRVKA
jgi:hypothetical protein